MLYGGDPGGALRVFSRASAIATDMPGLYFLGEEFMYAAASATLPGSCRDARYLAGEILAASLL